MSIRKLASETAIYGMTTILGRLLNYLLVPLHSRIFAAEDYGIVTDVYAYTAFLNIVFTYGMESAFFRYASKSDNRQKIFWTATVSLIFSTAILTGFLLLFAGPIANWLQYPEHTGIIVAMALVMGLDALVAIPFALLRLEGKAMQFGKIKIINIAINIGGNIFFLLICPFLKKAGFTPIDYIYSEGVGVGYIFLSNLLASVVTLIMLLPWYRSYLPKEGTFFMAFDNDTWNQMLRFALPLLVVGLAGMVNEVFDRILLKWLLTGDRDYRLAQIGIYGACYKLSILMTLFTRAFSYASEPFFFKHADRSDALRLYAVVAKYFAIAGTAIFLLVMLYMDIIQYFIGANRYREGLGVVPILLLANLCLGLYYNVAIWYKNTDNTIYGTYISIFGAVITLALNFILIPRIGYMGSAWATLACYASMLIAAWYLGRKKYPVPYPVGKILIYIYVMFGMYAASDLFAEKLDTGMFLRLVFNTGLMAFYIWFVVRNEAINVKALILELKGKIPGFKKST